MMERLTFLLSPFALILITGCQDQLAAPEETGIRAEVVGAPALTPPGSQLVVAIKGGPEGVQGHSTRYTYDAVGRLSSLTRASGHASLADQGDPSRRFLYRFRAGEARCQAGAPVAVFSGDGLAIGPGGPPEPFTHQYSFSLPDEPLPPPEDAPPGQGRERHVIQVTLLEGQPADLVGVPFRIEGRAFFSSTICQTR